MSRKGHKVHKTLRSLCSLWSESPYFIAGSTCFVAGFMPVPRRACVWRTCVLCVGNRADVHKLIYGVHTCYVWGVRLPKKRPYAVPSAYSVVRMWCRPCVVLFVRGAVRARCRPRVLPSAYSVVRARCRPRTASSVCGAVRARCRPRVLPYAHTDEIMVEYLFHFTGKANR